MKNRVVLPVLLIAASAILAVVSFLLLPQTVIVQFSVGGSSPSTLPKFAAVLIPTALGVGGAVACLASKSDGRTGAKALLVSGVGILVFAFMLIVNLAGK